MTTASRDPVDAGRDAAVVGTRDELGAFPLAITTLMDLDGGHGRNMGAAGIAVGAEAALGAPVGGQLYGAGPLALLVASAVLLVAVAAVPDRAPTREGGLRAGPSGLPNAGTAGPLRLRLHRPLHSRVLRAGRHVLPRGGLRP